MVDPFPEDLRMCMFSRIFGASVFQATRDRCTSMLTPLSSSSARLSLKVSARREFEKVSGEVQPFIPGGLGAHRCA